MARSSRPARRSSIVSRAAAAAASVRRAAGRKTRPASVSSGLDHVKAIAGAAEPLLLGGGDEGLELSQLHPPIISEAQHIVADRDNHRSSYGELQQPLEVVDAEIGGGPGEEDAGVVDHRLVGRERPIRPRRSGGREHRVAVGADVGRSDSIGCANRTGLAGCWMR